MSEFVLIAVIAMIVILYRHSRKLKALEAEIRTLRAQGVAPSALPQNSKFTEAIAVDTASAEQAETTEGAKLPANEDTEEAVGPWAQAARQSDQTIDGAPEGDIKPEVPAPAKPRPDIETALGTRWAVWVGGLALALGGIFLVRYSIEAGIFGPGVRLTFAALFGLALTAGGEFARRRGFQSPIGGINGAYIPAILTAAGSFVLFGAVFAAHSVYGFIGPVFAFGLLGIIGIGTITAALIHGQALAGLGLLGSYATPILVSSDAPSAWTLFIYLAIVLTAATIIASTRHWRFLAAAAFVGAGLWSMVYLSDSTDIVAAPVAMLHLVGLAVLAVVWLAKARPEISSIGDPASIAAGIFAGLTAIALVLLPDAAVASGQFWGFVLIVALLAAAIWRPGGAALISAAGASVLIIQLRDLLAGGFLLEWIFGATRSAWLVVPGQSYFNYSVALAFIFLAAGIVLAQRTVAAFPMRAALWAFWATCVPIVVLVAAWLNYGNLNIDWRYAACGFALAAILVAASEWIARTEQPSFTGGWAISFLLGGAALSFAYALLAGFSPIWTTILTGLAAALPAAATRFRRYPCLGWLSAGLAIITLGRIVVDPTIAGWNALGTTPFFNALLPGYLLPAFAFGYAAWQLAQTTGKRPRFIMEAFCALFALVGIGMLVRHAMHGGIIGAGAPLLAEQAIYTLIAIGAGGIMLSLDQRSPSPVFRYGSMIVGVLSVYFIAVSHFIDLNPLKTNESTGTIPIINLILLAYLLPAIAMAALARYAREKRPRWYVIMLAICSAALAFFYVSLSVRRLFQGEFIGGWKGMSGLENYTYSAVWLALGVAMLAAGMRFQSRVLRLGSAALVVLAVAKAFLYDMSELDGVLRALSFIGLGAVLIGIGMFYQRMLATAAK